ncbi:MAG: MTH1187 family thiamine-binding protein [Chloroflexi bacterium]|nr:MTH1187 family thiamine-binding protein [Chloroflexota bacterium]
MKESVIAELKVLPVGTSTPSLSRYISACVSAIKGSPEVSYNVTAMGTIVQGTMEQVLELAQKVHEVPFTMGVQRVVTTIYIDDRRDKAATIESKVGAVS